MNPRRTFLGTVFGGLAAAVAGLFGKSAAAKEAEHATWTMNYSVCFDDADIERLKEQGRCMEACRIMREHGFSMKFASPIFRHFGDDRQWFLASSDGWLSHWHSNLPAISDPVDALISAEPLYLAWKADQPAQVKATFVPKAEPEPLSVEELMDVREYLRESGQASA